MQAIKPIVTGWQCGAPEVSDTGKIIKSLGFDVTNEHIERVSPWRFCYPCAPNIAARMENKTIIYEEVVAFCNKNRTAVPNSTLLIEGAGGVMSPITEDKTCIDLIRDLNVDVILVVGSYLGAISHILTALEVLRGKTNVHIVLTVQHGDDRYHRNIIEFVRKYSGREIYLQEFLPGNEHDEWIKTSPEVVDFILGRRKEDVLVRT